MAGKTVVLSSNTAQILKRMGARIRKARLRRNLSMEILSKQANISNFTLSSIEKGMSSVSIGAYASVLTVLGLDKDFELIALDEEGKKQFWENNLRRRERASRR